MNKLKKKAGRKRTYDAEKTHEVILDAAEASFAEHGYNGVSMDSIAEKSGYNKSLLFQYFGSKLGLYTEVVKRADMAMSELLGQVIARLSGAEEIVEDRQSFGGFLEVLCGTFFDYLLQHPRFMRMLAWEQAEGWSTYAEIVPRMMADEDNLLETIFQKAQTRGLLRSNLPSIIQTSTILQLCLTYITYIPLYEIVLHDKKTLRSQDSLLRARAYVVHFVVGGMIKDR